MRKVHVTRHFFEAGGPPGDFFEKTKKNVFRCGLGEREYKNFRSVSFFVWPGGVTQINTQIHTYTTEIRNILDRLLASRGF